MNDFFNDTLIWFCIGFAFFLLEFLLPGFILFFFGVGAWIVAIMTLMAEVSVNTQILVFIGSSVITVLLLRNWLKAKFGTTVNDTELEDEFVGKVGQAETNIGPNQQGKVEFKGTMWDAISDEPILAGENVLITGTKSIKLIVKPIQNN
ncbi:NfeD family protein [Pedobacter faecalis]|uniref:NfeD family protein n=1 Tax=Pedobacter faecalis TaxID=3041495 RepID=UPI00254E2353|nr:NfeD family protein [Pedobacter sp. ELA7]